MATAAVSLPEAPRIATAQARASPIIRAEAVAAVRRGLRRAFSPASGSDRAEAGRNSGVQAVQQRATEHRRGGRRPGGPRRRPTTVTQPARGMSVSRPSAMRDHTDRQP